MEGTYYEHVTINKSLTLQGEDRETTIIDGGGSGIVIYATASNITISGLTATNGVSGIKLIGNWSINHITLKNMIITQNQIGFHALHIGGYHLIDDCIISNNIAATYTHQFSYSIIKNCEVFGNTSGISVAWGSNTLITNNDVHHNTNTGIHFDSMFRSIIEKNNMHDNECGAEVGYVGQNNTIRDNIFKQNLVGMRFHEPNVRYNKVYHNDFIDNTVQAQDDYATNTWNNSSHIGGNYWNDYTGSDLNNDGIGDSPYIFNNNKDNYPLMQPLFNTPPVINYVSASDDVVQVDTEITLSVDYTDNENNLANATIDWGDENPPDVYTYNLSTPILKAHNYTHPGVYTVIVSITDENGETDTKTYQYIIVYDPSAGFVTGGGWIRSPKGSFTTDPDLSGKASFGFISKYKNEKTKPDGNSEFQLKAGNLNFKSTEYDWLVITDAKAIFTGSGTVNNSGNYGILLSAIDAELDPGAKTDKFRIKIWNKNNGNVVYDNNILNDDMDDPVTDIGGGSIVIHKTKHKSALIKSDFPLVENFRLSVYPNPFTDKLYIEFTSPYDNFAQIDLFDLTGRLVKTVFNNPVERGITYSTEFLPESKTNTMYFYRMKLGDISINRKILYNK